MFIQLSLLILLLPLLGFIVLIFSGKRLPRQGDWLGTGLLTVTLILSVVLLISKLTGSPDETITSVFNWIVFTDAMMVGTLAIEFGIMIDNLTVVMLVVVTLVSTLVHLFSMGYMKGEKRYSRYYAYLGLFSFSMLGIVLTHNLLLMYIFWELVGVSSYLLIGFYYEKKSASNAANKAFIVNRVGDFGMFIGIMILFTGFSTLSFEALFDAIASGQLPFDSTGWLTASGLLIFCGAVGKSAQFPLHVWLPDAMEGPTPVSALIHAATMVAAGVYLVARVFPMLTADALLVIAYVGAITSLIAASIAITQYDIKKVLAYSTISQLGYMIMALGVGAFTAGFMHLVTHAAFKAGLFLGAGSVIFAMHKVLHDQHDHTTDAQDIRNMGGLKSKMPITYWTFLIFTLAISGIPLTSGFLSKDEILAGTMAFSTLNGHWLLPLIGFLVAGLTAFYMFRLLILTFHGKPANDSVISNIKESPKVMTIPLMVLAALSLFFFYSFNPIGAASGWFYSAIERPASIVPEMMQPATWAVFYEAIHSVHTLVMILSILIAGTGIALAYFVYSKKAISAEMLAQKAGFLYRGSQNNWYFDDIYNKVFVGGAIALSKGLHWFDDHIIDGIVNGSAVVVRGFAMVSKWIDNNVIDGLVNLTAWLSQLGGQLLGKLQTGRVQTYLVYIVFSFIVLFLLFI
ncbi:NADH-quinone oxidoreductase subunit L [Rhodohalobacter barkolensis]|uniref:NADH-quinone oxidoreductase subunit L n=1 Tax=Rhodohalobacter barkolensis TaxID=2053187 RepID=A0A2N0VLD8_9BACT|nr:NADH-quinone oxidoreductase subunit L [Rhodohalobacter barkolensis]PKD44974.1 NADH-quinone oxidoreductase subunit L [Rhodohalobacter barkolensis]